MRNRPNVLLIVVALLQTASGALRADQVERGETPAMETFVANVRKYVQLRNALEAEVGKLNPTDDQAKIAERQKGVAAKIAAARAQAQPGDLFTPEATKVFKTLVAADFKGRTPKGKQILLDEVPTFAPKVNMTYPSEFPLATFPATLLKAFPELPPEVDFRFVARHMVLRDTEANIIVDFVLNVIP